MTDDLQKEFLVAMHALVRGHIPQAFDACQNVLRFDPHHAAALHLKGLLLLRVRRLAEALEPLRQATLYDPQNAEFHNTLGAAFAQLGQENKAIILFERAVAIRPGYVQAYVNLATALQSLGKFNAAEQAARTALHEEPLNSRAYSILGTALRRQGKIFQGIRAHVRALRLGEVSSVALTQLSEDFQFSGRIKGAISCFRRILRSNPIDSITHSSLLYIQHYDPSADVVHITSEHRRWSLQHAFPLEPQIRSHRNDRTPGRRLRIGYISADFREHSTMRFVEPLITARDHRQFAICCYADVKRPDRVTRRLQTSVDLWRDIRGHDDAAVAKVIRQDQIDILIDPTGHMGANRMLVFARKPAPIQVAFPGYPGSCGLQTMDGFITDAFQNPPGQEDEAYFTERLIRLPLSSRCYRIDGNEPDESPLPAIGNRYITFGSFNRLLKVNPPIIRAWAGILKGVPKARLLIHAGLRGEGEHTHRLRRQFAREGIPVSRIEFVGHLPRPEYLKLIGRVDIALDSFPYNGCTTTCDALWMGVPTISLAGTTYVSRVGLSILSQVGLHTLAVASPADYVNAALDLAADTPRLDRLRQTLRNSMRNSPLCDAPGVTASFEKELRKIWVEWCARGGRAV